MKTRIVALALSVTALSSGGPAFAQAPDSCSGWYVQCTEGGSATRWIAACEDARAQCLKTGTFVAPRNGVIHGPGLKRR